MLAVGRLALIRPHSTKSVQFAARGASFGGRTVCVRQFSPAATSACSPLSRRGAVRQLVVYATQANKQRGHQAPMSTSAPDPAVVRLREHQQSAPRQTFPDECKTLVDLGRYGVLSTISKEYDGHPNGSIVGFASDDKGRPVFVFSTMSGHTRDVMEDPRCTLTVTAPDFKGAADARVSLTGKLTRVSAEELPAAKKLYIGKHPDAFWVEFGDFSFWRMDEIIGIRLVGGFARAGSVPPHLFEKAVPDPVAGAGGTIAAKWNASAPDAPAKWVKHYVGDVGIDKAVIASLDKLGLNLVAQRGPDTLKMRLPFPEEAVTVEDVEKQLSAMVTASGK